MSSRRVFDPVGVIFGVALPLAAAATVLIVANAWNSRLPAEIASHWSGRTPDGFSDPMSLAGVFALIIVIVGGGCCGVAALAQALLLMRRAMLLIGLTVVGLLLTLFVSVLWIQLDVTSVADVELPSNAIAIGVLVGLAAGALGAALLRDHRDRAPATEPPSPELPRGPMHAVRDIVGFGRVGTVVVAVIALGSAWLAGVFVGSAWPLFAALPVVVVLLALMRFDVIVDAAGVRVRNCGLTSIDIGMDEVLGAKVDHVSPFKDFGGWGLRSKGHRRYGIVTNTGPAVVISTADGLVLTITSTKADAMAGALNSWADHRVRR